MLGAYRVALLPLLVLVQVGCAPARHMVRVQTADSLGKRAPVSAAKPSFTSARGRRRSGGHRRWSSPAGIERGTHRRGPAWPGQVEGDKKRPWLPKGHPHWAAGVSIRGAFRPGLSARELLG